MVGDLAYAHDGPQSRWRYWMEEVEPFAGRVPFMVGCGNHDCLYLEDNPHRVGWPEAVATAGVDGGQCGVPYNARFWMPGDPALIGGWREASGGRRNNLFYSFEVGMVHVAVLSSEHDLTAGSAQLAWLEADLGGLDRGARPFVLVCLHRPPYTSTAPPAGQAELPETAGLRAALEPLLLAHRATAVLAGHYHQYERSCPLANGTCVDSGSAGGPAAGGAGPVYVTAGVAGLSASDAWQDPAPAWVRARSTDRHGYLRLDVVNATHLRAAAVDATDDSTFDEFWLTA